VTDGPVETFLAELGRHLRRDDATRRRIVAEVGDHLRDLVAEGRARGLDQHGAELEAIDRFGSPRALARGLRGPRRDARAAWAVTALVGAGLCGALVFADLRSGTPGRSTPLAGQVTPVGCVVAFPLSTSPGAHQVLVATRIWIDPRYGTVRSCHRLAMGLAGTVASHITSVAPPNEAPLSDVSMATAWHQ
jgi:hypothetical protein